MSKIGLFFLSFLSLITTTFIIPGIHIASLTSAFIAALVISIINTFLKPILQLISLPLSIITLGFFSLLLNGFLFLLASWIVPGFVIVNLWWAILVALAYSIISAFLSYIFTAES